MTLFGLPARWLGPLAAMFVAGLVLAGCTLSSDTSLLSESELITPFGDTVEDLVADVLGLLALDGLGDLVLVLLVQVLALVDGFLDTHGGPPFSANDRIGCATHVHSAWNRGAGEG